MKLIVCCATPWELKTVKWEIKKLNLKLNLDIFYLCTGIWNYETIFSLTNYFSSHWEEDTFLLNIWICGYRKAGVSGTLPKFIQIWRIKNLHTNKELLAPIPTILWKIESIYCSETIVLEAPVEENYWYVDMESRGVELCCNKFNIPHIFLKVPYDRIGQETKEFNKDLACKTLAENIDYETIIKTILSLHENQ